MVLLTPAGGELSVTRTGRLAMDFPARPGERIPVRDKITAAFGASQPSCIALADLLAIFSAESEVATLNRILI
jgi:hypothetical protein